MITRSSLNHEVSTFAVLAVVIPVHSQPRNLKTHEADLLGVRLFSSNAPVFQAHVARALSLADDNLRKLIPYSVLIRNQSKRQILALVVRYDLRDPSGNSGCWIREMQLLTQDVQHWKPIQHGAAFVIGPTMQIGHWIASVGGASEASSGYGAPSTGTLIEAASTLATLAQMQSVSISLDSVLFADGQFAGPDRWRTFERYSAWISAWRDLTQELQTQLQQGRSDDSIKSFLLGKRELEPTSFDVRDDRGHAQQLLARRFVGVLTAQGRSTLIAEVRRRSAQPQFVMFR